MLGAPPNYTPTETFTPLSGETITLPSPAVEPNYMAQAADILASDPTASATFNIGEKGITEAAARKATQEAATRPFQERLIEGAVSQSRSFCSFFCIFII